MSQLKDPFRRSRTKMFGETIAIGDSNRVTVLDKFDFQSCTISINCSARELVVNNCTFQDCLIGAKKAQADHQFFTSTFERCKFVGDFWGCEFGFRNALHGKTRGTIADSDLSEARLDLVSFNNCDVGTLKLPHWPHFTILDPSATAKLIPNPKTCGDLDTLKATCLAQKPITKAITCYAEFLLEETIYDRVELRRLLSSVTGILL